MAIFNLKDSTNWKAFFYSDKGRRGMLIIGLIGIGMIFLSGVFSNVRVSGITESQSIPILTAQEHAKQLEMRLTEIIRQIEGVGNCSVMVTLESGTEYRYAQEEKSDHYTSESKQEANLEKKYVFYDTGDGKQALILAEIEPTVKGVVIVCGGARHAAVQQRVIQVVTTALGISSTKVCVAPLS